ncbi:isoprenyl transferase [Myroides sp. LJL119]
MNLEHQLDLNKLPQHVAIIMDGNGRWAKKQGFLRTIGHENGVKSVRSTIKTCVDLKIPFLTLYAFSTENWSRPKFEIDMLMDLMVRSLKKELDTFMQNNVVLTAMGNIDLLPSKVQKNLKQVMETTKSNTGLTITLALSYGSRNEIIQAIQNISNKVKNNLISVTDIDESIINEHLYTHDLPEVDLLIRTSGEQRISNFMLWQIAYAELYFTEVLWPDFCEQEFYKALLTYQNRERRFGKTSEQL